MNSVGIYFGLDVISVAQVKGSKFLGHLRIPYSVVSSNQLEEKVPDEVKIVALFKEEFRKNKIVADEANLVLSGKDLIIRTFEMPVLPANELQSAVNFEAKKYIPFKLEELILDYFLFYDKGSRKNMVLLVGIKKEILDKYLFIFNQLNIPLASVEYSAFTIFRVLKVSGFKERGVTAIVNYDFNDNDEVNFLVFQNGFPLFSRDIILSSEGTDEAAGASLGSNELNLEKLKAELRISLDFYKRKFPAKNITKLLFVAHENQRGVLENFAKERSVPFEIIDTTRIDKTFSFSLSILKAYGGALNKTIKTPLKIDLLGAKQKSKAKKEVVAAAKVEAFSLSDFFRVDFKFVFLGLLICGVTFGFGFYRKVPLQKEVASIINERPSVSTAKKDSSYEQLSSISSTYATKISTLNNLISRQLYLTQELNTIPQIIPEGVWLTDFTFNKKPEETNVELTLRGLAYLGDSEKELKAVNAFVGNMKENQSFSRSFKKFNITSVDHVTVYDTLVTNFIITCTN